VGRGFCVMDSSICVAVITGRRASQALAMICFCTTGTFSGLISTPKSPRATITPSDTRRISSRLSIASGFSSLAITGTSCFARKIAFLACSTSFRAANKTHRNEIRSLFQSENQIFVIFGRDGGDAQSHSGQIDALMLAEEPAVDDFAIHLCRGSRDHMQFDQAVAQQNTVPAGDVAGHARIGRAHPFARPLYRTNRNRKALPLTSCTGCWPFSAPVRIFGP